MIRAHVGLRNTLLHIWLMAVSTAGVSQPLWRLEPSDFDYASVGKDISRERLHSLVERDDIDRYYGPATLLAYYYGNKEKDFILDRLRFTIAPNAPIDQWWLYFQYNYIAGYLGEQSAIQGMEEISSMMPVTDERRFRAIQLLAQNGHFDHFDALHDALGQSEYMPIVINCLGLYGQQNQFHDDAVALLVDLIRGSSEDAYVSSAAETLSKFELSLAKQELNERFLASRGQFRHLLFIDLDILDPDGQADRSMIAIPDESDETLRDMYVPRFGTIAGNGTANGWETGGYVTPRYVRFCKDRLAIDPSPMVRGVIETFLSEFTALRPAETVPVPAMIDSMLMSQLYDGQTYGWIGDKEFVHYLDSVYVSDASRLYLTWQRKACAKLIRGLEHDIDLAYKRPTEERFVTIEAYKFLHYQAQYILDRLP